MEILPLLRRLRKPVEAFDISLISVTGQEISVYIGTQSGHILDAAF